LVRLTPISAAISVVNSSVPMVRKLMRPRDEDQRHDDHLQQLHVAVADQVEPADGALQHRAVVAINSMQRGAEDHAEDQREQHLFSQAPISATGLQQAQQQRQEYQQVEDQGQIHESSRRMVKRLCGRSC
jgi:hypothetical protein